jgi:hypothetical protein
MSEAHVCDGHCRRVKTVSAKINAESNLLTATDERSVSGARDQYRQLPPLLHIMAFRGRYVNHNTISTPSPTSTTSSCRINPANGVNDDTHQTTQPPCTEAERWQDKHLHPCRQSVRGHPMATELDRIQVLKIGDGRITSFWLRLIGPGLSLNVELAAPESGWKRNSVKLSMDAIPEHYRDIIEIGFWTRGYFADYFAFIQQHNLHWWDFSQVDVDQRFNECLLWAYVYRITATVYSGQC